MIDRFFELLKKHNLSVSAAESCTGGMISAAITDISGASQYFGTGVVTYSNEAKMNILGVKADTLSKHGAVSPETAAEMADGVRRLSGSDIAVSVTGIAGPTGGTAEKPVGLVYIGISGKFGTFSYKNNFAGSRSEVRRQTVDTAFELACGYITKFYG